jgi:hypothetical protein
VVLCCCFLAIFCIPEETSVKSCQHPPLYKAAHHVLLISGSCNL